MIQQFFNSKEPSRPSTLVKQWNVALQCRVQSTGEVSSQAQNLLLLDVNLAYSWRPIYYRERIQAAVIGIARIEQLRQQARDACCRERSLAALEEGTNEPWRYAAPSNWLGYRGSGPSALKSSVKDCKRT